MSVHVEISGTIRIAAPPAAAFRFFTPDGERAYVAGWEPEYLHPADGTLREGLTFRTRHGGEETLWLVSHLAEPRAADYVRVTPGSRIGVVSVRLDPAAGSASDVTVTYRLTSLAPAGDAVVGEFARTFPEFLAGWERSINGLLAPGA